MYITMFENILARFTGSFFSYFLAGFTGSFFSYFLVGFGGIQLHVWAVETISDRISYLLRQHNDRIEINMDKIVRYIDKIENKKSKWF